VIEEDLVDYDDEDPEEEFMSMHRVPSNVNSNSNANHNIMTTSEEVATPAT